MTFSLSDKFARQVSEHLKIAYQMLVDYAFTEEDLTVMLKDSISIVMIQIVAEIIDHSIEKSEQSKAMKVDTDAIKSV